MQIFRRPLAQLLLGMLCYLVFSTLVMASFAGIGPESIGQVIDVIVVTGNERTQEKFVIKWSGLKPGQKLNLKSLNQARQALRDTGLFKQINFQSEGPPGGELTLNIILEEKNYTLLLPRASRNGDGDIKAGFRLRMYNIQGADQTFQMLWQREEEAIGDDSEGIRLRYKLPLYDYPYELGWNLNQRVRNTEVEDFDNVETSSLFSMSVSRDWNLKAPISPINVESRVIFQKRDLEVPYPDDIEAREAGYFNRLSLAFIFDDVHSERYRRYGSEYSITFAQGFDWLGSDYESSIVTLEAIKFIRLNRYDNFNFRVVAEFSDDSPFDYQRYSIGGSSNLRGLEGIDDRGDARTFANFEYIYSYRRKPAIRSTLFIDIGNVYENLNGIDLSDLRYTIGTGFRWKIQSFVRTDLFLDYGYDVEDRDGKIYGGTSLAF